MIQCTSSNVFCKYRSVLETADMPGDASARIASHITVYIISHRIEKQ